jgi:hypothetical protein
MRPGTRLSCSVLSLGLSLLQSHHNVLHSIGLMVHGRHGDGVGPGDEEPPELTLLCGGDVMVNYATPWAELTPRDICSS